MGCSFSLEESIESTHSAAKRSAAGQFRRESTGRFLLLFLLLFLLPRLLPMRLGQCVLLIGRHCRHQLQSVDEQIAGLAQGGCGWSRAGAAADQIVCIVSLSEDLGYEGHVLQRSGRETWLLWMLWMMMMLLLLLVMMRMRLRLGLPLCLYLCLPLLTGMQQKV